MNISKLTPLFFISFIFCQFVSVEVNIDYNELDHDFHSKKNIISNLDNEIKNYFLLNKFCREYDFIELDLKIQLIIESVTPNSSGRLNQIKSHLLITNDKDQYYFIKGMNFDYVKNKALIYNPFMFDGFESILNYYAFLFIGYELDTWGFNLGTSYFNKSLEISSESSGEIGNLNRKDEIISILENPMLRQARFLHFSYFDLINSDDYIKKPSKYQEELMDIMLQFYESIKDIYSKKGYDKNTLKFINSDSEEIAKRLYRFKMQDALKFLTSFDSENKGIYTKYIE
jgi:hypothetical protein